MAAFRWCNATAQTALENGASEAAEKSAAAKEMAKDAGKGILNDLLKGLAGFVVTVGIEYFANKSEDVNQQNVIDYNKNIQDTGTIGIIAQ